MIGSSTKTQGREVISLHKKDSMLTHNTRNVKKFAKLSVGDGFDIESKVSGLDITVLKRSLLIFKIRRKYVWGKSISLFWLGPLKSIHDE
jgi:hypothetical protein